MLFFYAEATGLGAGQYVETTQKHLPIRFLYAFEERLITRSSGDPNPNPHVPEMFREMLLFLTLVPEQACSRNVP